MPTHFLFDWIDTAEAERRYVLSDLVCFVKEALAQPHDGCDWEVRLSGSAALGLAHLLEAIEESLKFDITLPEPSQASGTTED